MNKWELYECDRCGKTFIGMESEIATAGFYKVNGGVGTWGRFAKSGKEKNVCDSCMWNDPLYISIYGDLRIRVNEKEQ